MPPVPRNPVAAERMRRRALIGTAVLVVLVALAAYLTRDSRSSSNHPSLKVSSAAPSAPAATPTPPGAHRSLPVPPSTHDPIAFGKAAATALWSYDTRASSRTALLGALHGWMTSERKYADTASVDAQVPSPALWDEMVADDQYATATAPEAHFPGSFTQALQADPGALTTAYVYAVTVSGRLSIAWKGASPGGGEARAITLAVQCRPEHTCALAGVMPNVAP